MFRTATLSILGATAIAIAISIPSSAQPGEGPTVIDPPLAGMIKQEPILLYDVTGSTLSGSVHLQVSVYNNGFATASKFHQPVFPSPGVVQGVEMAFLTNKEINRLRRDLAVAGAFANVDQNMFVSDVPRTTVTVFEGATDAKAHTYSYMIGSGPLADAQGVINAFMDQHFPGF